MMQFLHRNDFALGPISIHEIEPNLYLGSLAAAKDIPTLKKYSITHILTIDTCPLPRKILEMKNLTTKFIQLTDQPKEDLLSQFEDTNKFINQALQAGSILIHCYYGMSRSATVVIAYIMNKYKLKYSEAFKQVQLKRHIVCPNSGFTIQLRLYEDMNFIVDKANPKYKLFRLNAAADHVKRVNILPQQFFDLIGEDPGLIRIQPEPNVYKCKKCRRILASQSNLLVHTHKINGKICEEILFIEPLAWMEVVNRTAGKLKCPKCESKLGSFCWIMGCQCPCGKKVAPAFYLKPSKVDFSNVVKNVEVTF